MGSWADSRVITKKCWVLLRENKYFLMFVVLSFLMALIPMAIFGGLGAMFYAKEQGFFATILVIIGLLGATWAQQTAMAGLVVSADSELHGRDSSLGHGFSEATKKSGKILTWSVILVIVSLVLSLVRGNGESSAVGAILRGLLAGILDVAWQLITFFVLPFMMLENQNPPRAIKSSGMLLKQKWGTQLAGSFRIGGLILLLAILPAILVIIAGVFVSLLGTAGMVAGIPMIVIGIVVFFAAQAVLSAMKTVFAVALYHWAKDGEVLGDFNAQDLQTAVRTRG